MPKNGAHTAGTEALLFPGELFQLFPIFPEIIQVYFCCFWTGLRIDRKSANMDENDEKTAEMIYNPQTMAENDQSENDQTFFKKSQRRLPQVVKPA